VDVLEWGASGCLGSVPACLDAGYVEALPPPQRTSPSSTAGFRPIAHLSNWGTGRQTQHGLNKQDCRPCDFLPRSATDETPPWGRARASATSGEGEGPTRSPPPARLVYLLGSRRGSCGHLAQFEANGQRLMPILKDVGIMFASEPDNLEVRNIVNRWAISLATGSGRLVRFGAPTQATSWLLPQPSFSMPRQGHDRFGRCEHCARRSGVVKPLRGL